MSELRAAHQTNPEIGDVLASIRRLISQEDAGPDFAKPVRRLDASGKARSALPLGPKAELLRSVIERELGAVEFAEDRLVLRNDAPDLRDGTAGDDFDDAADLSQASDDDRMTEFDEAAYQMAVSAGLTGRGSSAARVTPIPPHRATARATETDAKENDMMLAEISRTDSRHDAESSRRDGFDLFATESTEDEDQMAGGNALRNLVRDVIRQELQGEMGDRISRNLRRAIRQEVTAAIEAGLKTA